MDFPCVTKLPEEVAASFTKPWWPHCVSPFPIKVQAEVALFVKGHLCPLAELWAKITEWEKVFGITSL